MEISKIKPNPKNPRVIRDDKFERLCKSIREFPEMLALRPVIVDADLVVLGGNMRLRACQEIGLTDVPVIIANNLTDEQKKEFIIKDNVGFGEWDWEQLANEWDEALLEEWGLDLPVFAFPEEEDDEPIDKTSWTLKVNCASEKDCQALYDKLTKGGYDCKMT